MDPTDAELYSMLLKHLADAGMNAVLEISPRGHVHTLAVTPPVAVPITDGRGKTFNAHRAAVKLLDYRGQDRAVHPVKAFRNAYSPAMRTAGAGDLSE